MAAGRRDSSEEERRHLPKGTDEFAGVSTTKCHGPGGLNTRSVSSHGSGGWKSKVKVQHSVSNESSLLAGRRPLSCFVSRGFPSVCAQPGVSGWREICCLFLF